MVTQFLFITQNCSPCNAFAFSFLTLHALHNYTVSINGGFSFLVLATSFACHLIQNEAGWTLDTLTDIKYQNDTSTCKSWILGYY